MIEAAPATVRLLEELGAEARPSPLVRYVGGWRVRMWPEVPLHGANSVLAHDGPGCDVADAIGAVEHLYAGAGLASSFRVSPASAPSDLDRVLADRGYAVEDPVRVLVASTEDVLTSTTGSTGSAAIVEPKLDDGWIDTYIQVHGADDQARARLRTFAVRLGEVPRPLGAVAVGARDAPDAVGLGIFARGWVGVFGMATRSAGRRRGAGRVVLHALARWARGRGADRMYLQVEESNTPARALYDSAGFTPVYEYWYRVEPDAAT